MKYKTTSLGGLECPSLAGEFRGTVDEKMSGGLLAMAAQMEKGQVPQPKKTADHQMRDGWTTITLDQGMKFKVLELVKSTENWKKMKQGLIQVMGYLDPWSAVEMKVKKKNDRLLVSFELKGERSFDLLLSKRAADVFTAGKSEISWVTPPTDWVYQLNKKRPKITFELLVKGEAEKLTFSNGNIAHHGAGQDPPPSEIFLCASLKE